MLQNSSQRSNKSTLFDTGRQSYYKAKKRELRQKNQSKLVIAEDAMFIKYYGMSAFLELFPEAKGFGMEWHRSVITELQKMDKKEMASYLSGISLAVGANLSKKVASKFKRVIKNISK